MKEYAHDWFDMKGLKESPNMMYAVNVKEDKKDLIPAVLHVDDTCRIQTVSKEGNEHFYNLIGEFWKLTGIPLLFNTSFNLAGDPLVETLDDALKVLNDSEMEYCYMPELNSLIRL
jgi:carbamoyltransferase